MARVTIEDCLGQVDNRFDLVLVASLRARELADGAEPYVSRQDDKPTVLALREIAAGKIDKSRLLARQREQSVMLPLSAQSGFNN